MLLYSAAIFLGAFLLFQIQPMIAKAILPWFGGSAGVWTNCLLFFQVLLLGGYLYAHGLAGRFGARRQAWVHVALLAASLLVLPVAPSEYWKPSGAGDPGLRILGLLAATIGLPYLLLSTGPLLQAWYARSQAPSTGSGAVPYRLFAVSNAGSLLGLLSFPLLAEPFLTTRRQLQVWSLGYAAFVLLCSAVALGAARAPGRAGTDPESSREPPPGWSVQVLWVLFPACSSTLLLAVTNHLTKNVAPIPFLWVLPLGLYLLSFVVCFEREGWYKRGSTLRLLLVAFAAMICGLSGFGEVIGLKTILAIFAGGLFICCLVCHGELARLKPLPRHLTRFYVMVAAGGALGGIFVALVAPRLFSGYSELPIGLVACVFLPALVLLRATARQRALLAAIGIALTAIVYVLLYTSAFQHEAKLVVRNFYGVLRVEDHATGERNARRRLTSGAINHGEQYLDPSRRRQPTAYYGPQSGAGLALLGCHRERPQRVGLIGLGAGILASYGRPGDHYRFYEINPLVVKLAQTQFSFLQDCPAKVDIVLGDGRLMLEREPAQSFDVLAVDAFSGDAIPVHLLTKEAFALYFHHLQTGGVLAVHITNRYLNLTPIIQLAIEALGKQAVVVESQVDPSRAILRATWVLAGEPGEFCSQPALRQAGFGPPIPPGIRLWTDDYSNLFRIIR